MLSWKRPSAEVLRHFLAAQAACDLSYSAVGATVTSPPQGFVVDHTRVELGSGESVFRSAKAALQTWRQFELSWVEAWPANTPIQVGENIVVIARVMGSSWLNACRVVRVIDEDDAVCRYGFAYGTLPEHAECGEEQFLIEWDRTTNKVFYDILAFSRPNHFLSRIGYPVMRRLQKRFGRHSAAAMMRAMRT